MANHLHPRSTPNTVPWPPIIFGASALAAVILGRLLPIHISAPWEFRLAGVAGASLGLLLDVSAMLAMRRHHANILPHRPATALVVTWPFSFSRNPIYLGNTLMFVSAAFAFDNAWFLPLAVIAVALVTKLAIEREELHLNASFGGPWRAYSTRVPRWLWPPPW
jgi:protein-S-isoprenylcysteine O-methyltransferase Ste14